MMAKNQILFATSEKTIPDGAYVGEWHKKTIQVEFNGWPRFYELKTTKSTKYRTDVIIISNNGELKVYYE